jgi:hypothetical protein
MFPLTLRERRQLVTICHRFESMKHSSAMPLAFTEHGVTMLASVLNSDRAIRASIGITGAFVRLRRMAASHQRFARRLSELESRIDRNDSAVASMQEALDSFLTPSEIPPRKIGFSP